MKSNNPPKEMHQTESSLTKQNNTGKNDMKMYVLVRKDLPNIQQAVQAGHAIAEFLLKFPYKHLYNWDNGVLVYLGVKDVNELGWWDHKLHKKSIAHASFREPDLNNEMTALATVTGSEGLFKKLQTLEL
ncbi:MAG: hypothetical protein ABFD07_10950 [Methanobacterium sp.]